MKKKFSKILGVGLTLALLCSLLLTAAPVSALTQPSVTFTPTTDAEISTVNAGYTISFRLVDDLVPTDKIVVTFPEGTTVAATPTVTIEGWCTPTLGYRAVTAPSATKVGTTRAVELTWTTDTITSLGTVKVTFVTGITNPDTAGSYTLTVGSQDTGDVVIEATVTSAAYEIKVPTISALPGIVKVYNAAGVLMTQKTGDTAIQQAIAAATATGYVIQIGPGTYDDATDSFDTTVAGVTFMSTGTAAETIWKGAVTIDVASTVIDGITIQGTVSITGALADKATIKNCTFIKTGTGLTAETLITYNNTIAVTPTGTITGNTIDTSLGAVKDTGILVNQPGLTISNNTFLVDGATVATSDSAINVADTAGTTTITGNIIAGASGIGVTVSGAGGTSTITSNTFSNLNVALNITAVATVTVQTNTIDTCGLAVSTTLTTGQAAIQVAGATALSITNNTITNCPNDIIEVGANSDLVIMMFNNMTGNTLGVDNNDGTLHTLNATHNWWGAATGPAADMNVGTATGLIDASGYLGATATGTFSLATATVTAATTQKVDVSIANASTGVASTAGIIGVANYSANPGAATPYPAISGGFFDVYVGTPTALADVATIKLYGAVTANTVAYVYNALQGTWTRCDSQGVNTTSGYVWVKTGLTINPAIGDLGGTAFALVEAPVGALTAPGITVPVSGDDTVSLTPIFAWDAVAAADGYYFQLADNANFVVPLVKLDGDLGRLIVTAYAYVTELDYSSAYYWRLKAVSGTEAAGDLAESAWSTGVFITKAEPVEPTPPVVIEEAPTLPDITIEQPDIIIQAPDVILPAETPVTPAWIYVIIGVGAVLVIALLVLIVRTRRVA